VLASLGVVGDGEKPSLPSLCVISPAFLLRSCESLVTTQGLMSIFGKILGSVFGKKKQESHEEVVAQAPAPATPETPLELPAPEPTPEAEQVDVSALLTEKAEANSEKLDWKVSIVDLLKLLGLDSSYGARKELALEVGIAGYEGTAEQNITLHKVVLQKLADNGGIIPADLLD